jgi:ribose 5-phosphate isomerase RpiB
MTNSTMMTMGTQTSRAKEMLTLLKRLVKNEYLYTEEKMREVKSQIKILEEEISTMEAKNSKGFGK